MGREYIAHGLYYRLLSYVFPRQPFWYYFTNYLLHVCVIGLSTRIVWQATRSWAAAVLCTLTGGFASTGPEVFLTLFKDELQTTLWLLVALLLVQGLMRPERSRYTGALVALGAATFLSGMLGKEIYGQGSSNKYPIYANNQVFESAAFPALLQGLWAASGSGSYAHPAIIELERSTNSFPNYSTLNTNLSAMQINLLANLTAGSVN
jgi:hypothetical protein